MTAWKKRFTGWTPSLKEMRHLLSETQDMHDPFLFNSNCQENAVSVSSFSEWHIKALISCPVDKLYNRLSYYLRDYADTMRVEMADISLTTGRLHYKSALRRAIRCLTDGPRKTKHQHHPNS